MLEVYSTNTTAAAGAPIALSNVSLLKGTSTQLQGVSSIQINKCGVYEVSVSATATADAAGAIIIQLRKDGVLQPQALTSTTAADITSQHALGFTTLVQVTHDNYSNCICSTPTIIDFVNSGVETTYNHINVTVVRI